MDLDRPRVALGRFPTALHADEALRARLGVDDLWIKRDDLTGYSWGGNKVRAVEFLLGDILDVGATTVLLAAGQSSNFAPTLANAALGHQIDVEQFAYGREPPVPHPALRLARQLGAAVRFTGDDDRSSMDHMVAQRGQELERQGAKPYPVPRGGASEVGALGFAAAAVELDRQLRAASYEPAAIVLPVGSGGSIAGLLVGMACVGVDRPVIGVSVSRPVDEIRSAIGRLATGCAHSLGLQPSDVPSIAVVDGRGAGFGCASQEETELALTIERECGILVDPVYNAKALRWLADSELSGPVLYWHTGGALGVAHRLTTMHDIHPG